MRTQESREPSGNSWIIILLFDLVSEFIATFPGGSDGKASLRNAGDQDLIPESGGSPGERNGYPLQYASLGNPMERGAWRATVHGVAKSWTWPATNSAEFLKSFQTHCFIWCLQQPCFFH